MDIEKFPNVDSVLDSIERLKKTKFPKFVEGVDIESFADNVSKIISKEFGFSLSTKIPYKAKDFLLSFYRARELDSFSNIDLFREHSYPPIDFTKMGRCNFPKLPVFYCSENPLTALLEVARNYVGTEKVYCLSKWELIPNNENIIFEHYLRVDLPKENQYRLLNESFRKNISSPFERSLKKRLNLEQENGLVEYFKYLDSQFMNDSDYSLSATLAYNSLYVDHSFRTDILMYPSVQTYFKGINLAVQPNFVENYLRIIRLYIVSLKQFDLNSGKITINMNKYGIVAKNAIMWMNIHPQDEQYKAFIKEDFGENISSQFNIEKK